MIADLYTLPLRERHIPLLAPYIREADLVDMKVAGMSAQEALAYGLFLGPAWGVWERGVGIIGAGGYTKQGAIWSLWADLSPEQSRGVMARAGEWARFIRSYAGGDKWLWNIYLKGNRQTEAFLRASHCVNIDKESSILHDGREFIPFHLKTAEELARV